MSGIGDKGKVTWPSVRKHAQVSGKGNCGRCTAARKRMPHFEDARGSQMRVFGKQSILVGKTSMGPWRRDSKDDTCLCGKRETHPQGTLVQSGQVEKEEIRGISRAAGGQEPVLQARSGWEALSMHSGTHSYSALRENSLHHKQSWAEPPQ